MLCEGYHASFLIAIILSFDVLTSPVIMARPLPNEKTGPVYFCKNRCA
jgi:hypothetical protein